MKYLKLILLNIILMSSVFAVDKASLVGNTPLHKAVQEQDTKAVATLLKDGALVDKRNYFCQTSLYIATKLGNTDIAAQLLKADARINALNCLRETPLHIAVRAQQLKMIVFLLSEGADW